MLLKADAMHKHVMALRSLTSEVVDVFTVTSFICLLYGFKTCDINDVRYKVFMHVSGGDKNESLARIKKINCASLPRCTKTLDNQIRIPLTIDERRQKTAWSLTGIQ